MLHLRRAVTPLSVALVILVTMWPEAVVGGEAEMDATDTVVRVIDGDTFVGQRLGRVRLADIDAPEVGEPGASEATDYLRSLIYPRLVLLDVDDGHGADKYGRVVAVVYVEHNATHLLNVNLALLRAGTVRLTDFPNEFDPETWTLYSPRHGGDGSIAQDSEVLRVGSLVVILVVSSLGVIALLRPPARPGEGGKVERQGTAIVTGMKSRTWRKIPPECFDELKELLLRLGATEDEEVRGESELWRCRIDDGVFTMYKTGTLYFSGGTSREAEIAARGVREVLRTQ